MAWDAVEEALTDAKAIVWDGCHKIYVALDEEQVTEFFDLGYDVKPAQIIRLYRDADEREAEVRVLKNWWDRSCGMRFVNSVRTVGADVDPNEGFTTLIGQFELDEDADDEEGDD